MLHVKKRTLLTTPMPSQDILYSFLTAIQNKIPPMKQPNYTIFNKFLTFTFLHLTKLTKHTSQAPTLRAPVVNLVYCPLVEAGKRHGFRGVVAV